LNLSELAREMVHLLQVSAPENAKFDFKAKEEPNWINGDGSQIRQVLINLITNATESLEAQRGTITVNTGIAKLNHAVVASSSATADLLDGEYAYVEVSDTGCGMAPAVQERIFEPFFTTKFQGRGLGLAAAQGIVHSHHGTIRVMSTVPTGTTIRVLFPSIPTPGDVVSATRPNAAGSRSGTVLIIDDERFVLNVAKRMLERSGYQVLAAGGGEAGVRIFQEHQNEVGAVLLDATMPGMDGEATFHALRGICHDLPVIFFTAHCETDMASLLSGKHDTTLLQKPFTLAALTNKVQEVIRVVGDG
jgi:CheY-like chemotaxis protein